MMMRARSKSLTAPSVCDELPRLVAGASFICQSVHAAGMSERLPSGKLASNRRTPRLRMLPMMAKLWPSKAWHLRVIITASGISR
jgi:hypothetical protein